MRMEVLDAMVLEALADKVLDPQRLKALLDETLSIRADKLRARREIVLRDLDTARQSRETPLDMLSPATMDAFAKVMRRRLLDTSTGLPKRYLQELVTEITFEGEVVRMQGRNAALLAAAAQRKMGTAAAVSIFAIDWCEEGAPRIVDLRGFRAGLGL